ncbi:acyltransferase [Arthrobacter sp. NPDC080073]|uniref:acyltransferase family protein n=1 Tax=Arthrobacter sp. NPDC080073 TaxID=3155919 RepID=UPI003427E967
MKYRELDLDVVRGVAILLAMGWHFNAVTGIPVIDVLLWPGHAIGWAGVDLFFVLSGFLVGRILLKERIKTGAFDRWRFMKRRALKLWPVLYVYLIAELFMSNNGWQTFFLQNIVHLQNYLGTSLSQLWSLAVEEHFYLLAAILFPIFARRGGQPKILLTIMTSVLAACLLFRFIGAAAGASEVQIQWQTHFRADSLAAGVILAVLSVHYEPMFTRMLKLRWLWLGLTVAGTAFLVIVPRPSFIGDTVGYTVAYITAGSFILLLYKAAWIPKTQWALRPLGRLGLYSYGLYIWHAAAAGFLVMVLTKAAPVVPAAAFVMESPVLVVVLKYAIAIATGIVMTIAIEWPALRIRDRFFPSEVHATDRPNAPTVSEVSVASGQVADVASNP